MISSMLAETTISATKGKQPSQSMVNVHILKDGCMHMHASTKYEARQPCH